MIDLQGKIALVTGASRGIGKAIALKLAQCGASVAVVFAGNEIKALETVSEIEAMNVKSKPYKCNVADFEATKQLIDKVITDFGGVDILVNNAGITKDCLMLKMNEEDFDAVIDVNLKGTFNMTKNLYQYFMKKRSGKIVNLSSVVGINGNAGQTNYSASKAGVIGLTKSIAKELASRGVTCNAVAPGYIETDMTSVLSDKAKESITSSIPMKKTGKAEDIANAVAFLVSDEASYITGVVLRVDGGMAM